MPSHDAFPFYPYIPDSGNILSGTANPATNAVTTIITIPANRTWYGTVTCIADNQTAGTGNATALVKTAGTNAIPAAGTIVAVAVDDGVSGANQSCVTTGPFYVQGGASGATLTVTNSTSTTFQSWATALGVLL